MRKILVGFALAVSSLAAIGADFLTGTWVTCVPKMGGRPYPYILTSVERESRELVIHDEWGSNFTFSGRARRVDKKFVVRGCTYERGEPTNGCDEKTPPIVSRNLPPFHKKASKNTNAAFKRSESIRTTDKAWSSLGDRCAAFVQSLEEK